MDDYYKLFRKKSSIWGTFILTHAVLQYAEDHIDKSHKVLWFSNTPSRQLSSYHTCSNIQNYHTRNRGDHRIKTKKEVVKQRIWHNIMNFRHNIEDPNHWWQWAPGQWYAIGEWWASKHLEPWRSDFLHSPSFVLLAPPFIDQRVMDKQNRFLDLKDFYSFGKEDIFGEWTVQWNLIYQASNCLQLCESMFLNLLYFAFFQL